MSVQSALKNIDIRIGHKIISRKFIHWVKFSLKRGEES